jgi:hypothetical protein
MKREFGEQSEEPSAERLAAYADGELDDASRDAVECWLATHPETAHEIKGQRDLLRAWQRLPAPAPSAAAWERVLTGIEAGLAERSHSRPRRVAGLPWIAATLAATAAAACVLVALWPAPAPVEEPQPPIIAEAPVPENEPFAVATNEDVAILTIDDEDVNLLIVGVPPLREPIELATKGDIIVNKVEPSEDGVLPKMWTPSDLPNPPNPKEP